jgi:tRNA(fMet)-specific endonuclease VapC
MSSPSRSHSSAPAGVILSEVLKQRNATVVRHASDYLERYGQFAFSAITRYEVVRGLKDKGAARQLRQFATFCEHSLILPVTDAVFDRAAGLWVTARKGGLPKRDADLLIAATALEHWLGLVTGNTAHFSWVPGLVVEDWRQA